MTPFAKVATTPSTREEVLPVLSAIADGQALSSLSARLAELRELAGSDMAETEADLATLHRPANIVAQSAHHLLDLGGKRVRPLCVALAARVGAGFSPAARHLAVAVELVHAATLLHDDVVDVGDTRRGKPTARTLYGNAASVFAGDWLLIEALKRVRQAAVPGVLDKLLFVIEEMIHAEAVQLKNRGRVGGGHSAP